MRAVGGVIKAIIGTAAIVSSAYFFVLTKEDREEVNKAVHKSISSILSTREKIMHTVRKENEEIDQSLEALQDSVRQQWHNLEK